MNRTTSVRTIPIPTVMRTWFSGRIVSTFRRGFRRNRWMTEPRRNRAGIATNRERYGSTPAR